MKFVILMTLLISSAQASNYYCTKWTKQNGVSCIFGGDRGSVWARQCENPCHYRNVGPHCDIEKVCSNVNPDTFENGCSRWVKERGVTCHNPSTGRWEQKWVRACEIGLATTWCSDEDPNHN